MAMNFPTLNLIQAINLGNRVAILVLSCNAQNINDIFNKKEKKILRMWDRMNIWGWVGSI